MYADGVKDSSDSNIGQGCNTIQISASIYCLKHFNKHSHLLYIKCMITQLPKKMHKKHGKIRDDKCNRAFEMNRWECHSMQKKLNVF